MEAWYNLKNIWKLTQQAQGRPCECLALQGIDMLSAKDMSLPGAAGGRRNDMERIETKKNERYSLISGFRALPRWQQAFFILLLVGNLVYYCLVFAIFRENCIIPPHDNLDSANAQFEMFRQYGLFFSLQKTGPAYLGLPAYDYPFMSFSFQSLLFALFPSFTAFALAYTTAFLLGFIGMLLLLEDVVRENTFLNLIVALLYAGLPVISPGAVAASTMPFLMWAIWRLYPTGKRFDKRTLLLVFFPFFSQLALFGAFLLGMWAISIVVCLIRKRTLPVNLLAGFAALCLGYVAVEWKLFYTVLFGGNDRGMFARATGPFSLTFRRLFVDGAAAYHVASLQQRLILPLAAVVLLGLAVVALLRSRKGRPSRLPELLSAGDRAVFLWTMALILAACALGALYGTGIVKPYIRRLLPFLATFQWGRFWVLNRVFWYVVFALCLKAVSRIPKCRLVAAALALAQMFVIATRIDWPSLYNYAGKTWINELLRKPRGAGASDAYISYDDFYAPELFSQIRSDLPDPDANVAAVGYHPAVLMYNGFHCIDGYLDTIDQTYFLKFRDLIAPELAQNEETRIYFEVRGSQRLYLYNDDASYTPTWKKYEDPITLRVDPDVMRQTFALKYILSRAPIGNQEQLGVKLFNEYHTDGLYDIYVYEVV